MPKCELVDWAGNKVYPGMEFDSVQDAWDFLMDDQHKRHPDVTDDEFDEILGEFDTFALD